MGLRRALVLGSLGVGLVTACGVSLDNTTTPPDGGGGDDPNRADSGVLTPANEDGGGDGAIDDGKERVVDVSPGGGFSCALTNRGRALCWGTNAREALAPESPDASCSLDNGLAGAFKQCVAPPVPIQTLNDVSKIAVGRYTACAIRKDGFVSCWGSNEVSGLGMGNLDDMNHAGPNVVGNNFNNAFDLSVGFHASCAVRKVGTTNEVWCWGSRDLGLIGTTPRLQQPPPNSSIDRAAPTRHPMLDGAKAVRVSHDYPNACAISANDQVVCWGVNHRGTLGHAEGDGDLDCFFGFGGGAQKCKADISIVGPDTKVSAIELGAGYGCAIAKDDRRLVCWGENRFGTIGTGSGDGNQNPNFKDVRGPAGQILHAKSLSATWHHICAMTDELGVTCWGTNNMFQLGPAMTGAANCEGQECVGARPLPFQQDIDKVVAGWDVTYLHNKASDSWSAIGANNWALLGRFPNTPPDVKCSNAAACSSTPAPISFPF